jgi:hypothetical protein
MRRRGATAQGAEQVSATAERTTIDVTHKCAIPFSVTEGNAVIIDVPDHKELRETAIGWMCLAWQITIDAIDDFQEWRSYREEVDNSFFGESADWEADVDESVQETLLEDTEKHWHSSRFRLNNAISLMQLSMELLLKARIAETSPFLLLVGEPKSWPSIDRNGTVSFADFQTIDGSQLLRAATIAGAQPLHADFNQFYDRVRKHRNKITHLNAGNIVVEAQRILVDMLTEFHYLFPGEHWTSFRKEYLNSTWEDWTVAGSGRKHSLLMWELSVAIDSLDNKITKKYFGYDKRRKHYFCPSCASLRQKHDQRGTFVELRRGGTIYCVACQTSFTKEEYIKGVKDWACDDAVLPGFARQADSK